MIKYLVLLILTIPYVVQGELVTSQQFQAPSVMDGIQKGIAIRGEIQRQNFERQDQENKYKLQVLVKEKTVKKKEKQEINININKLINTIYDSNIAGECQAYANIINLILITKRLSDERFVYQYIDTQVIKWKLNSRKQFYDVCISFTDEYELNIEVLKKQVKEK